MLIITHTLTIVYILCVNCTCLMTEITKISSKDITWGLLFHKQNDMSLLLSNHLAIDLEGSNIIIIGGHRILDQVAQKNISTCPPSYTCSSPCETTWNMESYLWRSIFFLIKKTSHKHNEIGVGSENLNLFICNFFKTIQPMT